MKYRPWQAYAIVAPLAIALATSVLPLRAQESDAGASDDDDGGAAPDAFDPAAPAIVAVEPAPRPSPPIAAAPPLDSPAIDVEVRAKPREAQRLRDSAEAVTIVETRIARQESADLGEVLARAQGLGVRRMGGLGSNAMVSLNGLQEDQIRLFLDGVPLHLAGYPFGVVNVPVNLVERLEIFRGVVPIRFGADALGGAINLVSDQNYETHAWGSYQLGSYGVHRVTLNGRLRDESTGIVAGAAAFLDLARNDYSMNDRELPTPDGRTIVRTVPRFHDGYVAYGGNLEAGVVDRPWARQLFVKAFGTTYDKELQHNQVMSVPYGEITYGETIWGLTARYDVDLASDVDLSLILNYADRRLDFRDLATTIYSWEGEPGRRVGRPDADGNLARGELRGEAIDRSISEQGYFGRGVLTWSFTTGQHLRASLTPSITRRIGDDHVEGRPDLLALRASVDQLVTGIEHELNLGGDLFQNVVFGKSYHFSATTESRVAISGQIVNRDRNLMRVGAGDALRVRVTPWLIVKASYEYATRLPRTDEIFGDGVLIDSSVDEYDPNPLHPEVSHNLNLSPRLELERTGAGDFALDVNLFARMVDDLIVLLAGKQFVPYINVSDVTVLGVDTFASWALPKRWLQVEGSVTYQDLRNHSEEGPYAPFEGERLPSRPYLFASWGIRSRAPGLSGSPFEVEPFYRGRYVHGFDRGWPIGDEDYKLSLPAQTSHTIGIIGRFRHDYGSLAMAFEIENLTDALLFDVYGVQRPGRAFYFKLSGEL